MTRFFSKTQLRVIIALLLLMILAFVYRCGAYSFENDWYNLEYKNYMKSPDSYTVQEVTIDDIIWYNGSNDLSLTRTEGSYLCIPRIEVINNHTVSGIAAGVTILLFVIIAGYAVVCFKKNQGV